ncbi:M1 family metallopeptidase [Natronospira bacteriovora]|uniref:Aminopeptidase N n=1 Tax=Natronospira bacteriovora TaxID=3069753 RepID=A0ABU0W8X6_9GAMM|nr:M1 family metallopeptidase [Natronospira sp. AB-CW4]MDQ2070496.1 M1 family metallopeptidase [Natronospira sp. AB-CW4]
MVRKLIACLLLAGFALSGCEREAPHPPAVPDPHSHANPEQVRVSHVHMDLDVDFDRQVLDGWARLDLNWVDRRASRLVLDTRDLEIHRVEFKSGEDWLETEFTLAEAEQHLGSALTIELTGQPDTVRVHYTTSPDASGLQWLTPEQTAGGEHPFLFSQGQPTHARSYVPLQDAPQVRITYSAVLRPPQGLFAVMSAENDPHAERDGRFLFNMPEAVPPYLIALAVGDLYFEPISDRVGVYAEPRYLEAAVEEFAVTQRMLEKAEARFGDYDWGRYDLLVLPPSFPYGGMENPRVSFVTPTIIAGDESLVSLISHELVHSWAGNLVNNAAWRDLWLNEGVTVYMEYRNMEDVYDRERADMQSVIGYQGLLAALDSLPPERQILAVDLSGRPADDVFTLIPYQKGRLFITEIEERFGRERTDDFLRRYFERFAFQAITTEHFREFLLENLIKGNEDIMSPERVHEWIYEPGMPEGYPVPRSTAFERVDEMSERWLADEIGISDIRRDDWHALQWVYFLNNLPDELSRARLDALDEAFDLTHSANYEVAAAWLEIAIRNRYEPAMERVREFLLEVGRMKFLRPLYAALVETDRELAEAIYLEARAGYHPLGRDTVERLLDED